VEVRLVKAKGERKREKKGKKQEERE